MIWNSFRNIFQKLKGLSGDKWQFFMNKYRVNIFKTLAEWFNFLLLNCSWWTTSNTWVRKYMDPGISLYIKTANQWDKCKVSCFLTFICSTVQLLCSLPASSRLILKGTMDFWLPSSGFLVPVNSWPQSLISSVSMRCLSQQFLCYQNSSQKSQNFGKFLLEGEIFTTKIR